MMSDGMVESSTDRRGAYHSELETAGGGNTGCDGETSATRESGGTGTTSPLPEAGQSGGSASGQRDGGERGEEEASTVVAVNRPAVVEEANSGEIALENDEGNPDGAGRTAMALPDDPVSASESYGERLRDSAVMKKERDDSEATEASSSQGEQSKASDPLTAALQTLFRNVAQFVQGELQLATNEYELLERMNLRAAREYDDHGDFAAGLRVFVEQVKEKHENFRGYLQQIDEIDRDVTHLEALVSTLDNYSSALYSKVTAAYGDQKPL